MPRRFGPVAIILFVVGFGSRLAVAEVVGAADAERRGFQAWATNKDEAARWFEQAAAAGRPAAQWMLGQHYFDAKGEARDVERTLELMRAAAVQGFAPAQSFLGWMYSDGTDIEQDPQQAFVWFSAAARQEDAYALRMLSTFYGSGVATEKNAELSQRLMLRSAELGDVISARTISVWLLYGVREQRDPPLAIHFLKKAAKANDISATYVLGREYLRGANMPHDPAAAAQWFQRSADAGNILASFWLSELHFKGLGVTQDRAHAEKILNEALTRATMQDKNQFAWELSVNSDERLRDGALAVRVLEPALKAVTEKVTAHVDTLAAAYAEIRQFDRAVLTQQSAIERARRERRPQEMIDGMTERLRLYERGQAYREVTL